MSLIEKPLAGESSSSDSDSDGSVDSVDSVDSLVLSYSRPATDRIKKLLLIGIVGFTTELDYELRDYGYELCV